MNKELTDREILEACARSRGYSLREPFRNGEFRVSEHDGLSFAWNPLTDDGDCARMENKCDVDVNCRHGRSIIVRRGESWPWEDFTPGNDAERRRASCLVVARAQLEKEKQT